MKNLLKKMIKSTAITLSTLITGILITFISFQLFDNLTANQMKILFAFDVICLVVIGAAVLLIYDKKQIKKKSKKEHSRRKYINQKMLQQELFEINRIINNSDFAA